MHRQHLPAITRTLVLAVALVAFGLALGASHAAAAGQPNVYTDPAGDSASAPDIQKVTMTDNGNGTVAVEIDLAAAIPDDGSSFLVFGIDADRNRSTGDPIGIEYAVEIDAGGSDLVKWTGGPQFVLANHQPLATVLAGPRITFTLTLSDIGSVSTFDFVVASSHGSDLDSAPSDGNFTFPQPVAAPTIRSIVIPAAKLLPKAGATLAIPTVQVRLSTDQIVTADSLTCTLKYKGHAVPSSGSCAWKIPKSYRKKSLTLTLVAGYRGATGTLSVPVIPR